MAMMDAQIVVMGAHIVNMGAHITIIETNLFMKGAYYRIMHAYIRSF